MAATISSQHQFELWCQIANRINEIKNILLKKEDDIPSFNQVQAKQFEEYTNEMRHALPFAGMDGLPDIERYRLTEEQYDKSLDEYFPYHRELRSFLLSNEFQRIFSVLKDISFSLKENIPDLYLELQLNNHLNESKTDKKNTEEMLRRNIAEILSGDNPSDEKAIQIKQVIINTYYDIRNTSGSSLSFLGFGKGSTLGDALEHFINNYILEHSKIAHHAKGAPPSIKTLMEHSNSGLQRKSEG